MSDDIRFDGQDKPSRAHLIALQDLYSGKIVAWRLAQSENKDAVRLAIGDMVTRHGIPETIVLDNGRAGLIVPPKDQDGLAAALTELILDPERRARLGETARRRAQERFGAERMARAYEALYGRLLA